MYQPIVNYPIDQVNAQCSRLCDAAHLEYDRRVEMQTEKQPVWFLVNGFLALFTHLTLDSDYDLYCYLSTEYHGRFGSIKAVRKGDDHAAKEGEGLPKMGFRKIIYPEHAINPMWVVYRDKTPEGMLETVLFAKFLHDMPLFGNGSALATRFTALFAPPADILEWDMLVHIPDWSPKVEELDTGFSTLYLFSRHKNGALWDETCELHLDSCMFADSPELWSAFSDGMREEYKEYPNWQGNAREGRCGCLYSVSSVKIGARK